MIHANKCMASSKNLPKSSMRHGADSGNVKLKRKQKSPVQVASLGLGWRLAESFNRHAAIPLLPLIEDISSLQLLGDEKIPEVLVSAICALAPAFSDDKTYAMSNQPLADLAHEQLNARKPTTATAVIVYLCLSQHALQSGRPCKAWECCKAAYNNASVLPPTDDVFKHPDIRWRTTFSCVLMRHFLSYVVDAGEHHITMGDGRTDANREKASREFFDACARKGVDTTTPDMWLVKLVLHWKIDEFSGNNNPIGCIHTSEVKKWHDRILKRLCVESGSSRDSFRADITTHTSVLHIIYHYAVLCTNWARMTSRPSDKHAEATATALSAAGAIADLADYCRNNEIADPFIGHAVLRSVVALLYRKPCEDRKRRISSSLLYLESMRHHGQIFSIYYRNLAEWRGYYRADRA